MNSSQRFLMDLHLKVRLLPKVVFSAHFVEQFKAVHEYHPEIRRRPRLVAHRNWGTDWSLAITPVFRCSIDSVFPGHHPEVEACLAGEQAARKYLESQYIESLGWSREKAENRIQKTMLLLETPPEELFSEVKILPDSGKFVITDGHHRAGVRRALGFSTHNVMVTIKIHRS